MEDDKLWFAIKEPNDFYLLTSQLKVAKEQDDILKFETEEEAEEFKKKNNLNEYKVIQIKLIKINKEELI